MRRALYVLPIGMFVAALWWIGSGLRAEQNSSSGSVISELVIRGAPVGDLAHVFDMIQQRRAMAVL